MTVYNPGQADADGDGWGADWPLETGPGQHKLMWQVAERHGLL